LSAVQNRRPDAATVRQTGSHLLLRQNPAKKNLQKNRNSFLGPDNQGERKKIAHFSLDRFATVTLWSKLVSQAFSSDPLALRKIIIHCVFGRRLVHNFLPFSAKKMAFFSKTNIKI
jgi:hypothetical protein